MRHGVQYLGIILVAGLAAAAQAGPGHGGPGHGGPGGPHRGGRPGKPDAPHLLAMLADADLSRDVTAEEWASFVASLGADENGAIDMSALIARLPIPPDAPADADPTAMLTKLLDQDGDGVVTTSDLDAFFALLDEDGDGALAQSELAPPEGKKPPRPDHGACQVDDATKAGFLLARAADADDDRIVSAEEWAAFLDSLAADESGAVSLDALAAALSAPESDDTTERDARLVRVFDYDGDGAVETSDLQAFFDGMDRNGDGATSKKEVKRGKPIRGKAKKAVLALARAADADANREVTAEEWQSFMDGLVVDEAGAVSLDDLASKLPAPKHAADADTTKRDAKLVRAFDKDGDGVITLADLQGLFDQGDRNADGALDAEDLRLPR